MINIFIDELFKMKSPASFVSSCISLYLFYFIVKLVYFNFKLDKRYYLPIRFIIIRFYALAFITLRFKIEILKVIPL
jgi:hypothetical protein